MAAMADETSTPSPQGGRPGGNREAGGFRIRLSDNEMRAARAVQEAFRLRSTVAALGFSLRTVAQLLEEGKLEEVVAEARSQAPRDGGRGGRRSGGEGRGGEGRGSDARPSRGERGPRIDPFARPSRPKPVAAAPSPDTEAVETATAEIVSLDTGADAATDGAATDAAAAVDESAGTEEI
jgi:hypothetical protein